MSPSVAPLLPLTAPPGCSGSWTEEPVTTSLLAPPLPARCSSSRFASRKWPRWLTPIASSYPCAVRLGVVAFVEGETAALRHRTSSDGAERCRSSANRRTDVRSARSQTIGTPPPAPTIATSARSSSRQTWKTLWPSARRSFAAERPMPCDEPVIATFSPAVARARSSMIASKDPAARAHAPRARRHVARPCACATLFGLGARDAALPGTLSPPALRPPTHVLRR